MIFFCLATKIYHASALHSLFMHQRREIMKKNRWAVEKNSECASWKANFFDTRMLDAQEFWQYVKKLLIAAEESEIMRIMETSKVSEVDRKYYFNKEESGESYVDFFERILAGQGEALFWQLSCVRVLSKLCYYDPSGQVVEEEMSYPAIALKKTRPELGRSETWPHKAIELHGYVGYETNSKSRDLLSSEFIADGKKYSAASLSIDVYSDIWFSLVAGNCDDQPAKQHYHLRDWEERIVNCARRKWFDNSELAQQHTPRPH